MTSPGLGERVENTTSGEFHIVSRFITLIAFISLATFAPAMAWASEGGMLNLEITGSGIGLTSLAVFIIAYLVVMVEEFTHLRKSKPVILAAGIIWTLIAWRVSTMEGLPHNAAELAFRSTFLEFAELFLFLLVAMTYINSMTERNVFEALRSWLVLKGFSYRKVFWITGGLAFFISPVADNLTTALLMCAVVLAVGGDNKRFISLSCINIVVGANSGGAFSPFGDITTLMVWQKGVVSFFEFFELFIPSAINFLVPALIMHFALPTGIPDAHGEPVKMKVGARRTILLFFITIVMTVTGHQVLDMPPVFGMLTGLGLLQVFGFYLKKTEHKKYSFEEAGQIIPFDIFEKVARAEWDTLLFFYGVLMCVGGLATLGYLHLVSTAMYDGWGPSYANIMVGVLSAIVDNIPVMFAVLTMNPVMDHGQWLLVTMTAGVGGSLLSIGSAAGVALMGQTKGIYTFFGHLRWSWAIALGYIASIAAHFLINARHFPSGFQF